MPDYSLLDQPGLIKFLFFPRKYHTACPANAFDTAFPVDRDVSITCRFHVAGRGLPWVLYFHGNGEVVSDYDQIAPIYNEIGLNMVVADYRGYGASGGFPTFASMVRDAHQLYLAVRKELAHRGLSGDLWVMGRSMGSISALELAFSYQDGLKGVIFESGFLAVSGLIKRLGLPVRGVNLDQFERECVDMAAAIKIPALVIHGEEDRLVPPDQGKFLYHHLGPARKKLVVIPGVGHNDIIFEGEETYFAAVKEFTGFIL